MKDPLFPVLPDDLKSLSDENLGALLDEHTIALDKIDAEDAEYTAGFSGEEILAELATGVDQIKALRAEQTARVEAHEAYQSEKTRLAAEARGTTVEPEPEVLAAEEPVVEPEAVVEETVVEETAVVAAAVEPARVYRRVPAATPIRVVSEDPVTALVAAAGVSGARPGESLDSRKLADVIIQTARRMGRPMKQKYGAREKTLLASVRYPFPEHRILRQGDLDGNFRKIALAGNPFLGKLGLDALTASGGLCAPATPFYDQPQLSTAARPVRAALPSYAAERGGVSVPTPRTIGDITTAITIVEEADDALGGTYATKSCQDLTCPTWTDVLVTAIAHCREYGNLNAMAWPEGIAHENEITMAAHSRVADGYLLDRIAALSLALTYSVGYGAISVLLGGFLQARSSTISVLRMDPGTRFQVLLPTWVADVVAWDVQNSQFDRFDTPQAAVTGLFSRYNLDVSWYYDTETGGGQVFSDEVTGGAVDRWPNSIIGYLYAPGTFLHLDSGDLELGIVRDSTLNSTNDFEVFGETFENVARIGPAQAAKKITFTACPTGEVAAPNGTAITCS